MESFDVVTFLFTQHWWSAFVVIGGFIGLFLAIMGFAYLIDGDDPVTGFVVFFVGAVIFGGGIFGLVTEQNINKNELKAAFQERGYTVVSKLSNEDVMFAEDSNGKTVQCSIADLGTNNTYRVLCK